MLAHVFGAFVKLRFVNYDCFFFFLNALTERLCEQCVCVRVCLSLTVYPHPFFFFFCLWSYPVYQHMFTELQEHASARFMKHTRYPESV